MGDTNMSLVAKEGTMQRPVIQSTRLRGHQGAVLCLDHSSSTTTLHSAPSSSFAAAASLLSGSEDGTCRVWDLRASCRAALCIKCPPATGDGGSVPEVLSVAFGPKWQKRQPEGSTDSASASSSLFAREYSVYAAVGDNVYAYDLRYNTSPIVTLPSTEFAIVQASDEINHIAFSPTSRRPRANRATKGASSPGNNAIQSIPCPLLAAANDSGTVIITDAVEGGDSPSDDDNASKPRVRVYCHGEDAVVTSLAFCPRSNTTNNSNGKQHSAAPLLLASGGTDCCVQLWDASKEKATRPGPLCSLSMSAATSSDSDNRNSSNQTCNPPMVHSLNWSPSGRLLVAGLGDGSVALMLLQQPSPTSCRLVLTSRLFDAHSGTVASCLFPEWTSNTTINTSHHSSGSKNHAIASHDRLLCTLGNDGCIVLWDLGMTVGGSKATDPAQLLKFPDDNDDGTNIGSDNQQRRRSDEVVDDMDQPQTLFAFQHTSKPNWMVSSRGRDPFLPSALFVADTSNDITVYSIPLQ